MNLSRGEVMWIINGFLMGLRRWISILYCRELGLYPPMIYKDKKDVHPTFFKVMGESFRTYRKIAIERKILRKKIQNNEHSREELLMYLISSRQGRNKLANVMVQPIRDRVPTTNR